MKPLFTSLALLGLAGLASLGGAWMLGGAHAEFDTRTASLGAGAAHALGPLGGYDLRKLPLVNATLHEVEARYVDGSRIEHDTMFRAALRSVERLVPTTLFRQEPGSALLHVQVGYHHTVVELEPITSRRSLEAALRTVAALIADHVEPADIAVDDGRDPWASVEYAMINGMLETLDPHSRLLPPEDSKEMDVENSGEFGGLGITIIDREGRLTVEYPLPETPAAEAGLQADDQILRIDGESTLNMSLQESVRRLRGPVGSSVKLTIGRDTVPEPFDVTIVRDRIKMNPVEGDLLDGGIGIVSVKSFHANVADDLDTTLARLAARAPGGKLSGLILDLRGNPGGYMKQAVAVSNKFLEGGLIVRSSGRGAEEETETARPARTEPRYPIAVLVDASSASASEIVAGALRNNDRAVTIGERTFGKGSVQNLEGFFDGSKLKLTIAQYYTPPGDKSIQAVGIPADIEIVPTVAERAADGTPIALVHYRERVRREADLERKLARQIEFVEEPVYALRTLRVAPERRRGPTLDYLKADPQVQLARDVLVAAKGRSRRADVLEVAAPILDRARRTSERELATAFDALGIDWTAGPSVPAATLDVRLDLGDDGVLTAGVEETIALVVTNRGSAPLHRVVAVTSSDSELLDGREFVFGRIAPGATVRFPQRLTPTEGYPTESTPLELTFLDGDGVTIAQVDERVPVVGRELPRLAWQWRLIDRGDGDGRAEAGELVGVELTVENLGRGPTTEAFARLRNRAGKALDLDLGTLEIGEPRTADGAACTLPATSGAPAGAEAAPPDDAAEATAGCARRLMPGASWTGELRIKVNEPSALAVELTVGDSRAYDYAAVMRSGFYEAFSNDEIIRFDGAGLLGEGERRAPPEVRITRAPPVEAERGSVVVSGQVVDDDGLAHVIVYHNDRKVFFADGGEGLAALPFTADLRLEPGLNTIVVVATDEHGLRGVRSTVTSWAPPVDASSADAATGPEAR